MLFLEFEGVDWWWMVVKTSFHIVVSVVSVVSVVRKKDSLDRYNFMKTSRTTAQYNRNDRYNLLYKIG